jgi:hypothetical protein
MSWVRPEMIKAWEAEWKDMPEYIQEDLEPVKDIMVHFETIEDMEAFAELVGQEITLKTKGIWYPAHERRSRINKVYIDES